MSAAKFRKRQGDSDKEGQGEEDCHNQGGRLPGHEPDFSRGDGKEKLDFHNIDCPERNSLTCQQDCTE